MRVTCAVSALCILVGAGCRDRTPPDAPTYPAAFEAQMKAATEIADLRSELKKLREDSRDLAEALGAVDLGSDGRVPLDAAVMRVNLAAVNEEFDPPLDPDEVTCAKVLDEARRQIRQLRASLAHKDSEIEELVSTRRLIEQLKNEEITRLTDEHRKAEERLEGNILQYERQASDLRERIRNLTSENGKVAAELAATRQELQDLRGKHEKK
jgi:predicted RNase H-like nuclease (RuvC/YqgF family)